MAETRRAVVLEFARRVRLFTLLRRMAFLGGLGVAARQEGRRRERRRVGRLRCIVMVLVVVIASNGSVDWMVGMLVHGR